MFVQLYARPDDEIPHGARNEDLAGGGRRLDAFRDRNRETPDVVTDEVNLAGVHAGPDLESDPANAITYRAREVERASRCVEDREEPVAHRLDLASSEVPELPSNDHVVLIEQFLPARISGSFGRRRRVDD